MRKLLATLAIATAMSIAAPFAYAGEDCCGSEAKAEKTANVEKGACPVTGDVAKGGADANKAVKAEGCTLDKAACADKLAKGGECPMGADVAKGGADENKASYGYKLGQKVPAFKITDTKGKEYDLGKLEGKPVMVVFYNQKCPYVVEMQDRFDSFAKEYKEKGLQVIAIDAGTNNAPEAVAEHAKMKVYPVALNTRQDLAVKFDAKKTPEVFLLDKDHKIVYHGAFDNGEKGAEDGARRSYAKDAADAVLAGKEVEVKQTSAFGCRISVKEENRAAAAEQAPAKEKATGAES